MLRAEVAHFQRQAVSAVRRRESPAAGAFDRGDELADHFHAVRKIEHDDAVRRLERPHLPLGVLSSFAPSTTSSMSAERTGIVADWKNGLIWPKLLDGADDEALADGSVVVAVGEQDRVQNFAQAGPALKTPLTVPSTSPATMLMFHCSPIMNRASLSDRPCRLRSPVRSRATARSSVVLDGAICRILGGRIRSTLDRRADRRSRCGLAGAASGQPVAPATPLA